jgi:hypothetical protein
LERIEADLQNARVEVTALRHNVKAIGALADAAPAASTPAAS